MKFVTFAAFMAVVLSVVLADVSKEPTIEILSVEECPSASQLLKKKVDWSIIEDEDEKLLSLTADIEEAVDLEKIRSEISIFRPNKEGNYEKLITIDGGMCNHLTQLLGDEWERAREEIEPEVIEPCTIEPGTYNLDKFVLMPENTNLPNLLPKGQLKIEISAQQDDITLQCVAIELMTE